MSQQSRTVLKTYFETGDTPTEAEFAHLIDSAFNLNEDRASDMLLDDDATTVEEAIAANTAKTGISSEQAAAITANTAKTGISSEQAAAITANTAKTGITSEQAAAITANTAKTGITSEQAAAITANTAKTGITTEQAAAITANTAKTGISSEQAAAITANTAKTGITSEQAAAITANTAKTGISSEQAAAITANTAKTGITSIQSQSINNYVSETVSEFFTEEYSDEYFSLTDLSGSTAQHVGSGTFTSYNTVTGVTVQITRAATSHTGGGKPYLRKSLDRGKTWGDWTAISGTNKLTVNYSFNNQQGGYITEGPNAGRLLCFYIDYNPAGVFITYFAYSDNDGDTWTVQSNTKRTGVEYIMNVGNNNILQFTEGSQDYVAVPVYEKYDDGVDIWMRLGLLCSLDDGDTFTEYRLSAVYDQTINRMGEPSIIDLKNGYMLMVCRDSGTTSTTGSHTGGMYQFISDDNFQTCTYQGVCDFDTQTIYDSANQYLPILSLLDIYGQNVVVCTYTNRNPDNISGVGGESVVRRIFALPSDLILTDGHERWNDDSLEDIHTFTKWFNNSGNGKAFYYPNSYSAVLTAEDQIGSEEAGLDIVDISIMPDTIATLLGLVFVIGRIFGKGAPTQAPTVANLLYIDKYNSKIYLSNGVSSVANWIEIG